MPAGARWSDISRPSLQSAQSPLCVDEVKRVQTDALSLYVTQQKFGLEMQNNGAEIVLRAERRAGQMLAIRDKSVGGRPGEKNPLHDVEGLAPTNAQLGLDSAHPSRWQAIARIPEEQFENYISEKKAQEEVTTAGTSYYVLGVCRQQ